MEKASRHRNGASGKAQPRSIDAMFAEIAASKIKWSTIPTTDQASWRLLEHGASAATEIARHRARNNDEIALKLTLLLDWLDDTMTASSRALLQSAIADLERPNEAQQTVERPSPAPRQLQVKINRSARPCTVDGVLYPSIIAASRALGVNVGAIRKIAPFN